MTRKRYMGVPWTYQDLNRYLRIIRVKQFFIERMINPCPQIVLVIMILPAASSNSSRREKNVHNRCRQKVQTLPRTFFIL